MKPRVLGARRLSRTRDNSTSFERQEAAIRGVVDSIGGALLPEFADDPDVSAAKVAPADRPGLGPWLSRPQDFDVIVWWRLDRAVRSMRDMAWLGSWAREHGKRLIFAEGPGGGRLELDMSSPVSELLMMVFAFAAQMEVLAIEERTAGSTAYLNSVGRWSGGRVPFGRMPVPHPVERDGYWLAKHDETADLISGMIELTLNKRSFHAVAAWLNAEHPAATPANHRRTLRGDEIDAAARWNPGMVAHLLRQPGLRGFKVVRGEIIRDDTGEPVLCGEPLISDQVWYRLQAEIDSRAVNPVQRSDAHPLLGVLYCGTCEGRMYQGWLAPGPNRKERVRQYRCAARAHGRECAKPAYVVAAGVDVYAEREFLTAFGRWPVVEEITYPGIDHTAEIAELESVVAELGSRIAELRGSAATVLLGQLQGRADRLDRLRQEPAREPRTEFRPTGSTYAELWASAGAQGRLAMMLDAGFRIDVGQTTRGARNVEKRLSARAGGFSDPVAAALDAVARELSM